MPREVQVDYQEKKKSSEVLEQSVQGSSGVTTPKSAEETYRCGAKGMVWHCGDELAVELDVLSSLSQL